MGRAIRLGLGLLVVVLGFAVFDGWRAFGQVAHGERAAALERSPQWDRDAGAFENPQPLWNDLSGMLTGFWSKSSEARPTMPIPVQPVDPARFATPPASGLRVTWLGHSTLLLEIEGHTILTDPVWGERASPLTWVGPQRWYPPPIALADLPRLDAVVLSHDHYDHLDYPTIVAMAAVDTVFVAPLGVGAHLEYWGVPAARIVELDWWGETRVGDLRLVCTPARHASGRILVDKNATLWAGWAIIGTEHRVYFSGDTGLFEGLRDIGEKLGPFDLTMIEAGAYNAAWPDWHLGPEQAVLAHQWVRGEVMLPIHWGLFDLAYHGWTEPIERVRVAAERREVTLINPAPGQSVEPAADAAAHDPWWPEVPWETAKAAPIVATAVRGVSE